MNKFKVGLAVLMILGALLPVTASAAIGFNDTSFATTWEKVDKPVQDLAGTGRGYTWGPQAPGSDGIVNEAYNGGMRKVQYFDKARMEINNPAGNRDDLFYVTTGLLVKELVTGDRQDGDNSFSFQGSSQVQVAGDSNEGGANAVAPTYDSFKNVGTFSGTENSQPQAAGQVINGRIDRVGAVSTFPPPERRFFTGYDTVTLHNVADVFIDYGNLQGTIWNGQAYVQGSIFFNNPLYVLGRPITEPYWVRTVVAGTERDVLVQLFERRVLTYTPSNPAGFKVEMGNVGQHYFRWRYSQSPTRQLASSQGLAAITAGNYVFWLERTNGINSLYGYDLRTGSQFLIAKPGGDLLFPASDGKIVAWVQGPVKFSSAEQSIQGYDLATGKTFEIVKANSLSVFESLSVDQGKVYYVDATQGHTGIYSHDLTSGQEKLVLVKGHNPLVKDGILVWQEDTQVGEIGPAATSLHLLKTDGSLKDTEIYTETGYLSGYSVSGDRVVWNFYPPDVHKDFGVYTVSSGKTQIISTGQPTRNPIINGDKVALTFSPSEGNPDWTVGIYDFKTGTITTVVRNKTVIEVWGLAGTNGVVYSIPDDQGVSKLYFTAIN